MSNANPAKNAVDIAATGNLISLEANAPPYHPTFHLPNLGLTTLLKIDPKLYVMLIEKSVL